VRTGRIASARLRLRALAARDLALFCTLYADPATMRFIGRPYARSVAATSLRATLQAMRRPDGPCFFVIADKLNGCDAGLCSIQPIAARERSAEVGVMLTRAARRKGYASEALTALIAAAFETLPIDTVWVQYRKANRGAAHLFGALGFHESDGWRPQGARRRLCVRILQRFRWRKHAIQPQMGVPMSNVIGFLESVGRDAALRHASREQLLHAMQGENIAPQLQSALLDSGRMEIDSLLGVREKIYCSNFPVKTPKKAPAKTPAKAPPKKAPAKKPTKKG
jgi:RimJ/RimL family protein N-acetyltransferase